MAFRIGIVVSHLPLPKYAAECIERLQASDACDLRLILRCRQTPCPPARPFVLGLYDRLDAKCFKEAPDPFAPVQTNGRANLPEAMDAELIESSDGWQFTDEVLRRLQSESLDILVDLTPLRRWSPKQSVARHGIWVFGQEETLRSNQLAGAFWIVANEVSVTSFAWASVEAGKDGKPTVLERFLLSTYRFSLHRNGTRGFRYAASFLMETLERVAREGFPTLPRDPADPGPIRDYPSFAMQILLLFRLVCRFARSQIRQRIKYEQWSLGFRFADAATLPKDFRDFQLISPPPDRYWADPFPVSHNGKHYVFIEEVIFEENVGFLSVMEYEEKAKRWSSPRVIIRNRYHMSYPQVFLYKGTYYMLPETSARRTVELHRCKEFPYVWELERVLMWNIEAVDATLHFDGELWWMFTALKAQDGSWREQLCLYYSKDPIKGEWTPHRKNPFKSDPRTTRGAGNIFTWGTHLLRPVQDCARDYGTQVILNKITKLSPDEFSEEPFLYYPKEWQRAVRTHTFNQCGNLWFVDGVVFHFGKRVLPDHIPYVATPENP